MTTFFKRFNIAFWGLIGTLAFAFVSCQKADLSPYSNPDTGTIIGTNTTAPTPADTTPSFLASVNSSSVLTFTPSKSISGSNTNLIGTDSYYTITLTFPSSTGPGHYTLGSFSGLYTAKLVNGSSTYVVDPRWGGGSLTIDSISSHGKYYGSFNFDATDTTNLASMNVDQGSFYHL